MFRWSFPIVPAPLSERRAALYVATQVNLYNLASIDEGCHAVMKWAKKGSWPYGCKCVLFPLHFDFLSDPDESDGVRQGNGHY